MDKCESQQLAEIGLGLKQYHKRLGLNCKQYDKIYEVNYGPTSQLWAKMSIGSTNTK